MQMQVQYSTVEKVRNKASEKKAGVQQSRALEEKPSVGSATSSCQPSPPLHFVQKLNKNRNLQKILSARCMVKISNLILQMLS